MIGVLFTSLKMCKKERRKISKGRKEGKHEKEEAGKPRGVGGAGNRSDSLQIQPAVSYVVIFNIKSKL